MLKFGHRLKKLVRKNLPYILIIIGVIGIGLSVALYRSEPKPPKAPPSDTKSVNVVAAPSSKKLAPKAIAAYTVPATDPKYIAIPSIGISNTPIVRLGLLKSGAIATPDNIFETGWYDGSSLPGQAGAMFIYGHVSSWTADGIFYNLKKLVAGDQITITRGDNKTYTYDVVSKQIYPSNNVNMNQVLAPVDGNMPGLNLMTCTGQVIKGTSEFNERLVVFTKLIP
jgi:LPXTG-site transpeptidase (sortase) family protein